MPPWVRLLVLAAIVALTVVALIIFKAKAYAFVSLVVAIAACVPFIYSFEKGKIGTRRLVMLAVMTALSVGGRLLFVYFSHFKPVAAIVVITGMYLGAQSGFICGAFSALLSGFYFGMGAFLPFQMLAWGLIGLFASLLSKALKKHILLLVLYAVLSGIFFSAVMDVWSVLWMDGGFNLSRYLATMLTALPITLTYAVSNAVFLAVLARPIGKKLERVLIKYGDA